MTDAGSYICFVPRAPARVTREHLAGYEELARLGTCPHVAKARPTDQRRHGGVDIFAVMDSPCNVPQPPGGLTCGKGATISLYIFVARRQNSEIRSNQRVTFTVESLEGSAVYFADGAKDGVHAVFESDESGVPVPSAVGERFAPTKMAWLRVIVEPKDREDFVELVLRFKVRNESYFPSGEKDAMGAGHVMSEQEAQILIFVPPLSENAIDVSDRSGDVKSDDPEGETLVF